MNLLPRVVIYKEDGSGRDTYISYNNGGRTHNFKNFPNNTINSSSPLRIPLPVITPRVIRYANDGSGRDSYVNRDDFSIKRVFVDNLRKYDKERSMSPRDRTPRLIDMEFLRNIQKAKAQDVLSKELSKPKIKKYTEK